MDLNAEHQPQHSTGRQFRLYNVVVTAWMALGSTGGGFAASIIATTLAQPSFLTYFGLLTRSNATQLIASTNGCYFAGGALGVFAASDMADRWGRRWAIGLSSLLVLVSSALMAASVDIAMFIVVRFFSGAGTFMVVAAVPVWMNETAPPSSRGILVDLHSIGILTGYVSASWSGYGTYHLSPTDNMAWRAPFIIGCVFPALNILALWWTPESPRWLLMKGRDDEARAVLQRLHTAQEAAVEYDQIRAAIEVDRRLDSSWWAMVRKPAYRKRAIYAVAMILGVESSGVLVINNYGPTIYSSLGFDTNKQLLYQCGWITTTLAGGVLSFFIIDRVPRPKLLSAGVMVCAVCLAILAAVVATFATPQALQNPNSSALQAGVAMMYIYILSFEVFLNGTIYVYMGELFPTHIRAKGVTLAVGAIPAINVLWTQVAPTAFQTIGWRFYLVFIILSAVASVALWFLFPDTLGIPLEEVARLFGDHEELYVQSHGQVAGDDSSGEKGATVNFKPTAVQDEQVVGKSHDV